MANQFYISAGLLPNDSGETTAANTFYISAGLVPDDTAGAITLRQFGFQFYQDNADHTPIGTENDASVSLAPGSKFRIRMGIVKE